VNADKLPTDYRIQTILLDPGKPFEVTLAPGGGAVIAIDAGR
jgi:hypothetical protein